MHFYGIHMAAGEHIISHSDSRPSCEIFQSNCCNKLPINGGAPILRCQMLSVRPRVQIASLCSPVSSSSSLSRLPITVCPRLWHRNGRHSPAWHKAWKQILAVLYFYLCILYLARNVPLRPLLLYTSPLSTVEPAMTSMHYLHSVVKAFRAFS